ncbi:hypothetical protein BDP55DRAFT_634803 [Colletotrichum godetiae]|uniref:HET domain-containing protein n=1 Tax=Colletotrichum godetiae TaxID=1209918 RepID=A0AAJ0EUR9_9PEZI|nr:uncharacterized protein BDP55DRAFT_634803 [Colletotrichum godetiae]KAK1672535.1 hypothetical protein BDP55DRAFT_634803 [Colletotrichum godetiae]
MYLGVDMRQNTPVCIVLTRTAEGLICSEPWLLTYEQSWNLSRIHNTFTIHVQNDVSLQEDAIFWRQKRRSFHIDLNLQTSLKLEQLELHPQYLWDEFHLAFIASNPDKSYPARLKFLIRDSDSNFSESFPLTLTLGWASSHQQPFALLYGSEELVDTTRLAIRNVPPDNFPDLVKDDIDWISSNKKSFEKALSRINTNPEFQATEVQFVTRKIMVLYCGLHKVSAFVATFRVELETRQNHNNRITYHASLSGKISRMEGRIAMLALKST